MAVFFNSHLVIFQGNANAEMQLHYFIIKNVSTIVARYLKIYIYAPRQSTLIQAIRSTKTLWYNSETML